MHVSMFCLCSFFRDETSKKDRVGNKPPYFWRSLMCMSLFPQNGIKQRRLFVNQNIFKQYLQSMYMNIHIQIHVCQKDYICVNICVYSGACDIYIFFQKTWLERTCDLWTTHSVNTFGLGQRQDWNNLNLWCRGAEGRDGRNLCQLFFQYICSSFKLRPWELSSRGLQI